jgi:hypothetical protein
VLRNSRFLHLAPLWNDEVVEVGMRVVQSVGRVLSLIGDTVGEFRRSR